MTFHRSSAGFVQSEVRFSYHHANEAGNDNLWVDVLACGVKKYRHKWKGCKHFI